MSTFYLETIEGNGFKVLFELLEKNFPTEIVHFKVNKNGIFIFMEDCNLIIDFAHYAKYMNIFEYNHNEEEFLFGINQSDLIEIRKKIRVKDILSLSVGGDIRNIQIGIGNTVSARCETYNKNILGIQNYINEIPGGYCDFPINLNNSRLFSSLWNKNKKLTRDDGVNIQLRKNTLKLSFHDTNSIIIGENYEDKPLYENIYKTELISNIIKISSFGTIRIYWGKDLPICFSAIIGCNSGNINLYVF